MPRQLESADQEEYYYLLLIILVVNVVVNSSKNLLYYSMIHGAKCRRSYNYTLKYVTGKKQTVEIETK